MDQSTWEPEMTAAGLVQLLVLLDSAGIEAWLDGGWGVDALIGRQTRPHKDADIIVRCADVSRLIELLSCRGFVLQPGGRYSNFVVAHAAGLEIDVHAITFDQSGNGIYRMANGEVWTYPADGFSGRGVIGGRPVRCLSPTAQVLCHAYGYVPTEKDIRDMALLRERFGVTLPPQLM